MKFTISGNCPSKKNNRIITFKGNRPFSIPSNNYRKWHDLAMSELMVKRIQRVDNIASIAMTFYPGSKRLGDLDNKASSVLDLLKTRDIIQDDNWHCVPRLFLFFGEVDAGNPRVEVEITQK